MYDGCYLGILLDPAATNTLHL